MFRLFLILFSFCILNNSSGQLTTIPGKPRQLTKQEQEDDYKNKNCAYHNKFTIKQRLQLYPFNLATKVALVSFSAPDSIIIGGKLPMKEGTVNLKELKEIKILNEADVNSLSDVLYNQGFKGHFYSFNNGCYNPRNAILFIDKNDKAFAFIEICFECQDYRLSSNKIKGVEFCYQKYEMLRNIFIKSELTFGVEPRE